MEGWGEGDEYDMDILHESLNKTNLKMGKSSCIAFLQESLYLLLPVRLETTEGGETQIKPAERG